MNELHNLPSAHQEADAWKYDANARRFITKIHKIRNRITFEISEHTKSITGSMFSYWVNDSRIQAKIKVTKIEELKSRFVKVWTETDSVKQMYVIKYGWQQLEHRWWLWTWKYRGSLGVGVPSCHVCCSLWSVVMRLLHRSHFSIFFLFLPRKQRCAQNVPCFSFFKGQIWHHGAWLEPTRQFLFWTFHLFFLFLFIILILVSDPSLIQTCQDKLGEK